MSQESVEIACRKSRPTGAGDGPIEIVEYDVSWPVLYVEERDRLAKWLPAVQINHIGSTSVPGLAAKPVIDMISLVEDLDAVAAVLTQRAGYQLPEQFNTDLIHRRFLCYPALSYRTHHLHLVDVREDMDKCLRFRESLRDSPELAAAYVALKRALASRYCADRKGYTAAKGSFINNADMKRVPRGDLPAGSGLRTAAERPT